MKSPKLILAVVGVALYTFGIVALLPLEAKPQPASAQQASAKYDGDCTGTETDGRCADKPYDPTNCQYPDRWSNPVGGCDNSDPAVPECIKAMSSKADEDACIATFVAQHNQTPAVTPAPVSQCGGAK